MNKDFFSPPCLFPRCIWRWRPTQKRFHPESSHEPTSISSTQCNSRTSSPSSSIHIQASRYSIPSTIHQPETVFSPIYIYILQRIPLLALGVRWSCNLCELHKLCKTQPRIVDSSFRFYGLLHLLIMLSSSFEDLISVLWVLCKIRSCPYWSPCLIVSFPEDRWDCYIPLGISWKFVCNFCNFCNLCSISKIPTMKLCRCCE